MPWPCTPFRQRARPAWMDSNKKSDLVLRLFAFMWRERMCAIHLFLWFAICVSRPKWLDLFGCIKCPQKINIICAEIGAKRSWNIIYLLTKVLWWKQAAAVADASFIQSAIAEILFGESYAFPKLKRTETNLLRLRCLHSNGDSA